MAALFSALLAVAAWLAAGQPCGPPASRDVAISAAFGLGWPELRGLVASFRHFAAPCAVLALLIDATAPEELLEVLRAYGAIAVLVGEAWPYVQLPRQLPITRLIQLIPKHFPAPDSTNRGSLVLLRHFLGEAWLEAALPEEDSEAELGLLLLVDSTDILFQADPFAAAAKLRGRRGAWVFEEHPWRTIAECSFNMKHVSTFGKLFREASGRKTVVNSGVILGSRDVVLSVVGVMRRLANLLEGLEVNDQGVLNYIMREPKASGWQPPGLRVIPHSRGPVRNVGPELFPSWRTYAPRDVKLGISDGWLVVLGEGGQPAPIVHQYNRNKRLSAALLERWDSSGGRLHTGPDLSQVHSVDDLEVELSLKHHDVADAAAAAKPCAEPSGCCRKRSRERRRKLLWASGGGTKVLSTLALLENVEACKSYGQTTTFLFNADLVGWARHLAQEADQGQETLLLQFAARFQIFLEGLQQQDEDAPRPFGLKRSWSLFLVCLDQACSKQADDDERAVAAWDVVADFLREEAKKAPWIYEELKALARPPGPDRRRFWEVMWADGQRPAVAANDSAVARRLRFRAPAPVAVVAA